MLHTDRRMCIHKRKKKTNGLCEKRQPKECIVFIRYYIFCMCRVIEKFAKHSIF